MPRGVTIRGHELCGGGQSIQSRQSRRLRRRERCRKTLQVDGMAASLHRCISAFACTQAKHHPPPPRAPSTLRPTTPPTPIAQFNSPCSPPCWNHACSCACIIWPLPCNLCPLLPPPLPLGISSPSPRASPNSQSPIAHRFTLRFCDVICARPIRAAFAEL